MNSLIFGFNGAAQDVFLFLFITEVGLTEGKKEWDRDYSWEVIIQSQIDSRVIKNKKNRHQHILES